MMSAAVTVVPSSSRYFSMILSSKSATASMRSWRCRATSSCISAGISPDSEVVPRSSV